MARPGTFRMEAWSSTTEGWERMEAGPGGHVWKPRATGEDAAIRCMAWTGLLGIPAMQVLDQAGTVVWRDSRRYPAAGPVIELPNEAAVRRAALDSLRDATEPVRPPAEAESLF